MRLQCIGHPPGHNAPTPPFPTRRSPELAVGGTPAFGEAVARAFAGAIGQGED